MFNYSTTWSASSWDGVNKWYLFNHEWKKKLKTRICPNQNTVDVEKSFLFLGVEEDSMNNRLRYNLMNIDRDRVPKYFYNSLCLNTNFLCNSEMSNPIHSILLNIHIHFHKSLFQHNYNSNLDILGYYFLHFLLFKFEK